MAKARLAFANVAVFAHDKKHYHRCGKAGKKGPDGLSPDQSR